MLTLTNLETNQLVELDPNSGSIQLDAAHDINLDALGDNVSQVLQQGNDLIIQMSNGQNIVVGNFYGFDVVGQIAGAGAGSAAAAGAAAGAGLGGSTLGLAAAGAGVAAMAGGAGGSSDAAPTVSEKALEDLSEFDGSEEAPEPTIAQYEVLGVTVAQEDLEATNEVLAAAVESGADITPELVEEIAAVASEFVNPESDAFDVTFDEGAFAIASDSDGDGVSEMRTVVTTDADGNRQSEIEFATDDAGNTILNEEDFAFIGADVDASDVDSVNAVLGAVVEADAAVTDEVLEEAAEVGAMFVNPDAADVDVTFDDGTFAITEDSDGDGVSEWTVTVHEDGSGEMQRMLELNVDESGETVLREEDFAYLGVDVDPTNVEATNEILGAALAEGGDTTEAYIENIAEVAETYTDTTADGRAVEVDEGTLRVREDTNGDGVTDGYASVILDENGEVKSDLVINLDTTTGEALLTEEQLESAGDTSVRDTRVDAVNDVLGAVIEADANVDQQYIENIASVAAKHVGNTSYVEVEAALVDNVLTMETDVTGDGEADVTSTVVLDDNGFVLSENKVINGVDQGTTVFTRDADGNTLTSIATNAAGVQTVQTFTRDDQGRTESLVIENDGVVTQTQDFTYDETSDGYTRVTSVFENGSTTPAYELTKVVDDQGRLVTNDEPPIYTSTIRTQSWEYSEPDADGNVERSVVIFEEDGSTWGSFDITVDSEGREIERTQYGGDTSNIGYIQIMEYDDYGRLTLRRRLTGNGTLSRDYAYTYNEFGAAADYTETWYNSNGGIDRKYTTLYDVDRQIIAKDSFRQGVTHNSFTNETSDDGLTTKVRRDLNGDNVVDKVDVHTSEMINGVLVNTQDVYYNTPAGEISSTTDYEYVVIAGEPKLVSQDSVLASGVQFRKDDRTYYADGTLETRSQANGLHNGEMRYNNDYTYNEDGQLLTHTYRDAANSTGNWNTKDEYTYDAITGDLLSKVTTNDMGGNFTTDRIRTWHYDSDGNPIQYQETTSDGVVDIFSTYTYDVDGNLASKTVTFNGTDTLVETYNADGVVLTRNQGDVDLDGALDLIAEKVFDADGNLLLNSLDTTGDGVLDRTATFTYDVDGNMASRTVTVDGAETLLVETYNADGVVLTLNEGDVDLDGALDLIVERVFDADGNLLTFSEDTTSDGVMNRVETYTYDVDGNMASKTVTVDGIDTLVETYNADGVVLTRNQGDVDLDGALDLIVEKAFDADGNLLLNSLDTTGDGVIDRAATFTYDVDGNMASRTVTVDGAETLLVETYNADGVVLTLNEGDVDLDGALDLIVERVFDADGNLLTFSEDTTSDGVMDRVETYTYDVDGNMASKTISVDGIDRFYTTFDATGQALARSSDTDQDGDFDLIQTFETSIFSDHIASYVKDNSNDGLFDEHVAYERDEYGYLQMTKEGSGDASSAFETLNFAVGMDFTFDLNTTEAATMVGLSEVVMGNESANSTLIISDDALAALADGNASYQLKISGGDADDTLEIGAGITATGNTVDADGTGEMYVEYAGTSGTFIVDPDVMVSSTLS